MDPQGDSHGDSARYPGEDVCQICSDTVGTIEDGEPFVACHVCVFPVCRPCYEYERKDDNQSCPQCKTKYKRHKGSPPVQGEEMDDVYLNDVAKNVTQPLRIREEKHKSIGRTLSWDSYSQGEDAAPPKYDKEPRLSNMPYLVSGRSVSGDLSAASPEHLSFASPYSGIRGKGNIRIIDPTRESGSSVFGNVAWRERIDGWKMKPEKSVGAMRVSHAPSEGRCVDFDASTDVVMDDSLL